MMYALICVPKDNDQWSNTEFLMRNVINPITHFLTFFCLLFIAIVYFIMPTLRDLVGNIVTTISICLIISQAADMSRLLTIYVNHVSLIAAGNVNVSKNHHKHIEYCHNNRLICFRIDMLYKFIGRILLVE